MEMKNTPLSSRRESWKALSVVAVLLLASAAAGRSCIVNAGTETYVQSTGYSQARSLELSSHTTTASVPAGTVETRRKTLDASAGRSLSTLPPGNVLIIR